MVRIIPQVSEELRLLNELNQSSHRADPWNPAPYLLCTFERDETDVCACFEHLTPYDEPPFRTVAQYIDFFRQALEVCPVLESVVDKPLTSFQGLAFLHEHFIANLNCSKQTSFKVDLSAGSSSMEFSRSSSISTTHSRLSHLTDWRVSHSHSTHSSARASPFPSAPSYQHPPEPDTDTSFDRTKFPVKYYLVDFSDAVKLSHPAPSSPPSDPDYNQNSCPYLKDVRGLGMLFNDMISNVITFSYPFYTW